MTRIDQLQTNRAKLAVQESYADADGSNDALSMKLQDARLNIEAEIMCSAPICLKDCIIMLDTVLEVHDLEHTAHQAIRTVSDFLRRFPKDVPKF